MTLRNDIADLAGVHSPNRLDKATAERSYRDVDQPDGGRYDSTVDLERDRDLVERCQAGDRAAFDSLYLRYRQRLERFCMQRLGDAHDAEDVAQETFARAWRALPTFGGDRRFYPWLTVIAGNLCVDTLRRRWRVAPVEEARLQAADPGYYETEDAVLREVDSQLVADAFSHLSNRHQRVLHLREGSGWTYQRIADHEGVGITAVETLLWRARQALKREFANVAGSDGKVSALAGFLLVLPKREAARVSKLLRNAAMASAHMTPGFGSARPLGGLGTSGAFGVFGPAVAITTGVVALAVGAVILPSSMPAGGPVPSSVPTVTVPAPEPQTASSLISGGNTNVGFPTVPTSSSPRSGAYGSIGSHGSTSETSPATVGSASTGSLGSAANGAGSILGGVLGGLGSSVTGATSAATSVGSSLGSAVAGLGAAVSGTGSAANGAGSILGGVLGGISGAGAP